MIKISTDNITKKNNNVMFVFDVSSQILTALFPSPKIVASSVTLESVVRCSEIYRSKIIWVCNHLCNIFGTLLILGRIYNSLYLTLCYSFKTFNFEMLIDSRMVVRQIQRTRCILFLAFPMVICFIYVSKLIRDIGLLSDIPLKLGHLRYSVVRFQTLLKPFVLLDLRTVPHQGEGVILHLVSTDTKVGGAPCCCRAEAAGLTPPLGLH